MEVEVSPTLRREDFPFESRFVEVLDAPMDPEVLRRRASDFSVAAVTGLYLDVLLDRQNGR